MLVTLGEIDTSKKTEGSGLCYSGKSSTFSLDRLYISTSNLTGFKDGTTNLFVDIYLPDFAAVQTKSIEEGSNAQGLMDKYTKFKSYKISSDNLNFLMSGERKIKFSNSHLLNGFAIDLEEVTARMIRVVIRSDSPHSSQSYSFINKYLRPVIIGKSCAQDSEADKGEVSEADKKVDAFLRSAITFYDTPKF